MSQLRHNAVMIAIAMAFAWFATPWARIGWDAIAVPHSYSTTISWLDYAFLSYWFFQFLWAAAFGTLLARTLRTRHTLWWSSAMGFALGLFQFALSNWTFAPNVPPSVYIWAYGQYLVPVIGALAGSWFATTYWPRTRTVQ